MHVVASFKSFHAFNRLLPENLIGSRPSGMGNNDFVDTTDPRCPRKIKRFLRNSGLKNNPDMAFQRPLKGCIERQMENRRLKHHAFIRWDDVRTQASDRRHDSADRSEFAMRIRNSVADDFGIICFKVHADVNALFKISIGNR